MFNNPFKKYQTGGSVTDEQRQEATEFVTWIKSNVEGFKDKSVEEIAKSLIDMRKSEEGEKSYQDLYKKFKSSKSKKSKFEDGGKFQQFICKHARGGLVNCGCGGMTLKAAEGDQVPEIVPAPTDSTVIAKGPYKGYTVYNTYTTTAPDGSVARYTVAKDNMGQYLRKQEINGNTAILGGYLDENRAWTPEGDVNYTNNPYMQKLFTFAPVPKKQPGGNILYAEDGLSRKQVRADKRLVKQKLREAARGTDTSASDRYQFALNEAKNIGNLQGMSRLERKNAVHDMILGRGQSALKDVNMPTIDLPRVDMSNINLPEVDGSLPDFEITAPTMDYSSIYNNFNDAFAAARKAGLKQFDWNGKPIAVVTDPNWKNRWISGQNMQPVQETNTPLGPEELERQRQEYWNGVNDEARQIRERAAETRRNRAIGEADYYAHATGADEDLESAWGSEEEMRRAQAKYAAEHGITWGYTEPDKTSAAYQKGLDAGKQNAQRSNAEGLATVASIVATPYIANWIGKGINAASNATKAGRAIQTAEQVSSGWNEGAGAVKAGRAIRDGRNVYYVGDYATDAVNTGTKALQAPQAGGAIDWADIIANNARAGYWKQGGILKGQSGLSRASGYYQRHANEGIIRKLQNFLAGRGYYEGDLDGKFGNQTYEAIRKYQRDNGLKDDGMWGEDTNEVHRVLGAGETTFNGSRSGAHAGKHTYGNNFVNRTYQKSGKVTYRDIDNAIAKAISDPEWFMGDTEDAKNWRMLFMKKNPDGNTIFNQIYDSNPEFFGQSRFSKKLPTDLAKEAYVNEINTARNNAARVIVPVIAAPLALANPLSAGTALAGGLVGSSIGRNVGSDMKRAVTDENGNVIGYQGTNTGVVSSHTGMDTPIVTPDRSNDGSIIGGAIGSILGSAVPGVIRSLGGISFNPRHNPTGVRMELKEPTLKEVKPKKDWRLIKPRGGGNRNWNKGNAENFKGKSAINWVRKLTNQPINESEISGYFTE